MHHLDEAEFRYACVRRAVETDLPREIGYLARHSGAMQGIMETVEMPDRLARISSNLSAKTTERWAGNAGKENSGN